MSPPLLLIHLCLCFAPAESSLFFSASAVTPIFDPSKIERFQENKNRRWSAESEATPVEGLANDPKVWKRRGITQFREGRYQDALFSFNQALLLKEDDPELWNHKGETLFKLDRKEEALSNFVKALEMRPLLTRALHNKGAVLLALGRFKKALAVYNLLIQRNPSDAMAWKEKAEIFFLSGRNFEALDAVLEALDIKPGFQAAMKLKQKLDKKIHSLRFNL